MSPVSAALLAGGRSTRFGADKCLAEIDGRPLWRRQLETLRELTSDIFVVAPSAPKWLPPSVRFVRDYVADCGPIAGIASALEAAAHDRVLILAVDLPAISGEYLGGLIEQTTPHRGVVPKIDTLYQPLSAVYPRIALGLTRAQTAGSDQSLQSLIRKLIAQGMMEVAAVMPGDRPLFRNVNRPGD